MQGRRADHFKEEGKADHLHFYDGGMVDHLNLNNGGMVDHLSWRDADHFNEGGMADHVILGFQYLHRSSHREGGMTGHCNIEMSEGWQIISIFYPRRDDRLFQ